MVHYMGSKARHASEIIAITTAGRKPKQAYVEPFVGGGNVICRVKGEPRIANDLNWRMVAYLDALGNKGYEPPRTMTETTWQQIKDAPDSYPPELVAFSATCLTFGSGWFSGWVKEDGRCLQGHNGAMRDAPGFRGVKFHSMRYEDFTLFIPDKSIVYCDPPYSGTAGYAGAKTDINLGESLTLNTWNRAAFWRWADKLIDAGHRVYVSEYAGPPSNIYKESTELKLERESAAARFRTLQSDSKSSREDRDVASKLIQAIEKKIQTYRVEQADRWKSVWEKEVTSDFSSTREANVKESKKEIERLFHRSEK